MKRWAKLFALAILALACDESGARESMRVLFVGNSWTGHGPSENSLASRQEQPPAKCYSLSEAEFNRLRAAADAR